MRGSPACYCRGKPTNTTIMLFLVNAVKTRQEEKNILRNSGDSESVIKDRINLLTGDGFSGRIFIVFIGFSSIQAFRLRVPADIFLVPRFCITSAGTEVAGRISRSGYRYLNSFVVSPIQGQGAQCCCAQMVRPDHGTFPMLRVSAGCGKRSGRSRGIIPTSQIADIPTVIPKNQRKRCKIRASIYLLRMGVILAS